MEEGSEALSLQSSYPPLRPNFRFSLPFVISHFFYSFQNCSAADYHSVLADGVLAKAKRINRHTSMDCRDMIWYVTHHLLCRISYFYHIPYYIQHTKHTNTGQLKWIELLIKQTGWIDKERNNFMTLLYVVANRELMALMPGLRITLMSLLEQTQDQLLQPCLLPHIPLLILLHMHPKQILLHLHPKQMLLQMHPKQIVPVKQKRSQGSTRSMVRQSFVGIKPLSIPGTVKLCERKRKSKKGSVRS